MATEAQLRLIKNLIAKHEVADEFVESLRGIYYAGKLTQEAASTALTLINTLPIRATEAITVTKAVVLRRGNAVFRVSPTLDGGYKTSVLRRRNGVYRFIHTHVPVSSLREASELDDLQAQKFRNATGHCGRCGLKAVHNHRCASAATSNKG